jgi:hypothetical protein
MNGQLEWDLYLMSICDNIKMTNDHNKKLVTSTSLIAIERDTIRIELKSSLSCSMLKTEEAILGH